MANGITFNFLIGKFLNITPKYILACYAIAKNAKSNAIKAIPIIFKAIDLKPFIEKRVKQNKK